MKPTLAKPKAHDPSGIKTGPNDAVAPDQISDALGPDVIDTLAQRTGLSKDRVVQILSQSLAT